MLREDNPTIAKAWAETGLCPFPNDQRSPEAGQALLNSQIEDRDDLPGLTRIGAPTQ